MFSSLYMSIMVDVSPEIKTVDKCFPIFLAHSRVSVVSVCFFHVYKKILLLLLFAHSI